MNRRSLQLITGFWLVIGGVSVADALIIESPTEGQTIAVGEEIPWKIRPAPGEVCESVAQGAPFNKETGRYEWTQMIPPQSTEGDGLGQRRLIITGEEVKGGENVCLDATVTINIILPPTTVLQRIDAKVKDEKDTFMFLYRDINGKVLRNVSMIDVRGFYSDGVKRDIALDSKTTYVSSDEKVIRRKEVGQEDKASYLEALGHGKAIITVRNGALEDTVSVEVEEEVCPPEAIKDGRLVSASKCGPPKKK